jgi:hypothetical protein
MCQVECSVFGKKERLAAVPPAVTSTELRLFPARSDTGRHASEAQQREQRQRRSGLGQRTLISRVRLSIRVGIGIGGLFRLAGRLVSRLLCLLILVRRLLLILRSRVLSYDHSSRERQDSEQHEQFLHSVFLFSSLFPAAAGRLGVNPETQVATRG